MKKIYNINFKNLFSLVLNWFFIIFIIISFYNFFVIKNTNKIYNIDNEKQINIVKINKTDKMFKEIEDKIWKKINNNFILEKIELWKYDNDKKCQNFKIYYYPTDINIFTSYFLQKWYSKEDIVKKIENWKYKSFVFKIKNDSKYFIEKNVINICLQ